MSKKLENSILLDPAALCPYKARGIITKKKLAPSRKLILIHSKSSQQISLPETNIIPQKIGRLTIGRLSFLLWGPIFKCHASFRKGNHPCNLVTLSNWITSSCNQLQANKSDSARNHLELRAIKLYKWSQGNKLRNQLPVFNKKIFCKFLVLLLPTLHGKNPPPPEIALPTTSNVTYSQYIKYWKIIRWLLSKKHQSSQVVPGNFTTMDHGTIIFSVPPDPPLPQWSVPHRWCHAQFPRHCRIHQPPASGYLWGMDGWGGVDDGGIHRNRLVVIFYRGKDLPKGQQIRKLDFILENLDLKFRVLDVFVELRFHFSLGELEMPKEKMQFPTRPARRPCSYPKLWQFHLSGTISSKWWRLDTANIEKYRNICTNSHGNSSHTKLRICRPWHRLGMILMPSYRAKAPAFRHLNNVSLH